MFVFSFRKRYRALHKDLVYLDDLIHLFFNFFLLLLLLLRCFGSWSPRE